MSAADKVVLTPAQVELRKLIDHTMNLHIPVQIHGAGHNGCTCGPGAYLSHREHQVAMIAQAVEKQAGACDTAGRSAADVLAEMEDSNTERGTMPGVRMRVRRYWAARIRAALAAPMMEPCAEFGEHPIGKHHDAVLAAASPDTAAPVDATCPDCGHIHTPDGCTGAPTPSDLWAGVTPSACDCDAPVDATLTDDERADVRRNARCLDCGTTAVGDATTTVEEQS